jgi:hypothetical protein
MHAAAHVAGDHEGQPTEHWLLNNIIAAGQRAAYTDREQVIVGHWITPGGRSAKQLCNQFSIQVRGPFANLAAFETQDQDPQLAALTAPLDHTCRRRKSNIRRWP